MCPIRHALSFQHQLSYTCFDVDLGVALSFVLESVWAVFGARYRVFQERNPNENKVGAAPLPHIYIEHGQYTKATSLTRKSS